MIDRANNLIYLLFRSCNELSPFFVGVPREYPQIMPPAQGKAEDSARLLLTKNPAGSVTPCLPRNGNGMVEVSRSNGFFGPGRWSLNQKYLYLTGYCAQLS